jgi:hypothetical protein
MLGAEKNRALREVPALLEYIYCSGAEHPWHASGLLSISRAQDHVTLQPALAERTVDYEMK